MNGKLLSMAAGAFCLVAAAEAARAVAPGASAATSPAIDLSPDLFTDRLSGFSLRPPANSEFSRDPSASRRVTWSCRDPKTGAIALTFSARCATEDKKDLDLSKYVQALEEKFKADGSMVVESMRVTQLAGKGAIDIRGPTSGIIRWWQRQVWVYAQPGRFVIFIASGPVEMKDQVLAASEAVLATVKLSDPMETLAQERLNVERAKKVLSELTDAKLAAIVADVRWYSLYLKDDQIGWMCQGERMVRNGGAYNIEIKMATRIQVAPSPPALSKIMATSSVDRQTEWWRDVAGVDDGNSIASSQEVGLKEAEVIVCDRWRSGRQQRLRKLLPKPPTDAEIAKEAAMADAQAIEDAVNRDMPGATEAARVAEIKVRTQARIAERLDAIARAVAVEMPGATPEARADEVRKRYQAQAKPRLEAEIKARIAARDAGQWVQGFYLTRALSMVLPRLLDLSKNESYTFAVYDGQINELEPRTFTVVGGETIDGAGGKTQAVRIVDVMGTNTQTTTEWWVDSKGMLLQMKTPSGFRMERAGQDEILQKYPQARGVLEEMRK